MKILFVTGYFPPTNVIGAVRTGKTAKWLKNAGHFINVLTPDRRQENPFLKVEVPEECILYTDWFDYSGRVRKVARGSLVPTEPNENLKKSKIMFLLESCYRGLVEFPDSENGWYPFAVRAGAQLIRACPFDIIYASATPYTALLVAARLSRLFDIPWVAEFRDLWMDNHYRHFGPIRKTLEGLLERRTLETASAFVTVSQTLADILKKKYPKPTEVITNGFDPDDYELGLNPDPGAPVRIVYTGSIYQGKRDPSPLLEAIGKLSDERVNVKVDFYGERLALVRGLAEKYGCRENVQIYPSVPYEESLRIQQKADVLLLLLWNDPREKGVFTGKVFEYMGARRPILVLGPEDNVASQTILERRAGTVLNEPGAIARQLMNWIKTKREKGMVPPPPADSVKGFTREEQTERLGEFLESVIIEGRRGK